MQRRVILDKLRATKSHPSAMEVFRRVRERLPRISLGTVYRNLQILSDSGEVLQLNVSGYEMRFDGDTRSHPHLRCEVCGAVEDVTLSDDELIGMEQEFLGKLGSRFHSVRLEFNGLCESCAKAAMRGLVSETTPSIQTKKSEKGKKPCKQK